MENEKDLNPDNNNNNSNNSNTESTMTRAQSNLDILSQTAAVIEGGIVSLSNSSSALSSPPYPPARVTPAEHHHNNDQVGSESSCLMEANCRKSFLSLPEMSNMSSNAQHQHQPTVFLERKRGFLPPSLPFEVSGRMLVGSQSAVMDGPSFYSPGLYLSYSNGSHSESTMSTIGNIGNSEAAHRAASAGSSASPPQQQLPQPHGAVATISTGSDNSGGSGAFTDNVGAGGDVATVVNSFLSAASNSFSSTGGASTTSIMGGAPTSSPFQFHGASSIAGPAPFSMQAAFVPPLPQRSDGGSNKGNGVGTNIEFSEESVRDNFLLRQQLAASDVTIANLQSQVESLQREVRQLRRLPTGKISQIPLQ
jgi:hypothetical protein